MKKRPLCTAAAVVLILLAVRNLWFGAECSNQSVLQEQIPDQAEVLVTGQVKRREERKDYGLLYLQNCQVLQKEKNSKSQSVKTQFKKSIKAMVMQEPELLIYLKQDQSNNQTIKSGNQIQVQGELSYFEEARNPGNFDQEFYYEKQGIHASVWADQYQITDLKTWKIRECLANFRRGWKQLLIAQMGERHGNSMSAIMLGEKSELDVQMKALYQKSGIGHILAISGLHMSFLGMGFYGILRKTGCPIRIAGVLGILFLLGYTIMIGGGVSAMRAFLMFTIRVGADICGRVYDMPTSLSVAGVWIALESPLYLQDAGYLLSFGAVLGMAAIYPVLAGSQKRATKLMQSFQASLAVNLVLLPVMLSFYYEFPPYSLFLNLVIIPLMSVVLGAGLLGSVLSLMFRPVGRLVLLLCKGVLELYELCSSLTMKLPCSRIVTGKPETVWIILYYAFLLAVCLYLSRQKKTRSKRACLAWGLLAMAGVCLAGSCQMRNRGIFQVTMLDVGQGDGIFLRSPGGAACFVDGGSSDVSKVGEYRIVPFLESQGVKDLDYVFISHGDADHMSGIEEILQNQSLGIRIRHLVLPPVRLHDDGLTKLGKTAVKNGTKVLGMEAGEELCLDEMSLTCMAPSQAYNGETGNAASMVLWLECRNLEMLLTGDVEGEGEVQLTDWMREHRKTKCDILKAAHHGSKNSTLPEFLQQLTPKYAWISSGIGNRYGHPSEETLTRLKEKGCLLYGTQEYGAVTLKIKGEKATIETFCKT